MPIVGDRPSHGLRVLLDLQAPKDEAGQARASIGPWRYDGSIVTPDRRFDVQVHVETNGDVTVVGAEVGVAGPEGKLPDDLAEKAKLIVRSAHRHARDEVKDAPPPRRIQRWRGEK